jgi:hypothetical protein
VEEDNSPPTTPDEPTTPPDTDRNPQNENCEFFCGFNGGCPSCTKICRCAIDNICDTVLIGGVDVCVISPSVRLNGLGLTSDDLAPIAMLTHLTGLDLTDNNITDVSGLAEILAKLPDFRSLTLSKNQIVDVSPLVFMRDYSYLDLSGNQIVDASPLANLRLFSLDLSSNLITDISAFCNESLDYNRWLYFRNNPVNEQSHHGRLFENRHSCWFEDCGEPLIIAGAEWCPSDTLFGYRHDLGDFEFTERFTAEDFEKIASMTNLRGVKIVSAGLTDISFLSGLPNLERLVLIDNRITDVSVLATLPSLQIADLSFNPHNRQQFRDIAQSLGLVVWGDTGSAMFAPYMIPHETPPIPYSYRVVRGGNTTLHIPTVATCYDEFQAHFPHFMQNETNPLDLFTEDFFVDNYVVWFSHAESSGGNSVDVGGVSENGEILVLRSDNGWTLDIGSWWIFVALSRDFAPDKFSVRVETTVPPQWCWDNGCSLGPCFGAICLPDCNSDMAAWDWFYCDCPPA